MRTSILYLFSILTLTTSLLYSQSDSSTNTKCFIIKADISTPVVLFLYSHPTVAVTMERGFSKRHSIQLTGMYGTWAREGNSLYKDEYIKYSQTRIQAIIDYKCFWKNNNFKGFYCGPYLRVINYDSKYVFNSTIWLQSNTENLKQLGLGAGAIIGYQTYFANNHFVLDFLFGAGVRDAILISPVDNSQLPVWARPNAGIAGFDLRGNINIGYRF